MYLNIVLVAVSVLQAGGEECRNGWIRHGDSCYMFSRDTENWVMARSTCTAAGAKLLEIDDETEDHFVQGWVDQLNQSYWAGGSDLEVNGEWTWTSTNEMLVYTNWNPGEPSDVHQTIAEDCLELSPNSGWKDSICQRTHNYICEKETLSVGHTCRTGWIRHNNSCYLFSRDAENWDTAKATCGIYGAKLVEINDSMEDQFLENWINQLKAVAFWLGGTDRYNHGQWVWDSGKEPFQYTNWAPAEPETDHCLQFWYQHGWDDYKCDAARRFICEMEDTCV